jgi:hypothetical protein
MTVIHRKSLGDTQLLTVDSDPSGADAAPIASEARLLDGSATWINTDGGTTWQRNDGRASEARGLTDGDDTELSFGTVSDGDAMVRDGSTVRGNPGAPAGYASAIAYAGNGTVTFLNGLTPAKGEAYVVTGATGTPTAGSSDELSEGDGAEYNGAEWKKVWSNASGFPPDGTRALVANSTLAGVTLQAPLTDPTDEGKLAVWDGTSLTPALSIPSTGTLVLVNAGVGLLMAFGLSVVAGFRVWAQIGYAKDLIGQGLDVNGLFELVAKLGSGMDFDGSDAIIPKIDGSTIVDSGGTLEVNPGALADGSTIIEGGGGTLEVDPDGHSHPDKHPLIIDDVPSVWYIGGRAISEMNTIAPATPPLGFIIYPGFTCRAESTGTPVYPGSAAIARGDLVQWTHGWPALVCD